MEDGQAAREMHITRALQIIVLVAIALQLASGVSQKKGRKGGSIIVCADLHLIRRSMVNW